MGDTLVREGGSPRLRCASAGRSFEGMRKAIRMCVSVLSLLFTSVVAFLTWLYFGLADLVLEGMNKPVRIWASVFSLVFASAVALVTWIDLAFADTGCPKEHTTQGAAIDTAIIVVLLASLGEPLLIQMVRARSHLLVGALLLGAATLGLALALVAFESATYTSANPTSADCDAGSQTVHVGFLYTLWGVPLAVLLLEVLRAWSAAHRPSQGKLAPS
jgi:hypothetical protein